MRKRMFRKRLGATVISAAMLMTAVSGPLTSVQAEEVRSGIGFTYDFENNVSAPWRIYQETPAEVRTDTTGGTFNIEILDNTSTKEGMYDLGWAYRGITLKAGVQYHVHAEITADNDGSIFTRIGRTDGDGIDFWHNNMGATDSAEGYEGVESIGESWGLLSVTSGETLIIDAVFTPDELMKKGEWAFYFGGKGEYNATDCFPNGTTLHFDNIMLYDEESGPRDPYSPKSGQSTTQFAVNQVGYNFYSTKRAVLYSDLPISEDDFFLVDAQTLRPIYRSQLWDSDTSFTGTPDPQSGKFVKYADFTKFDREGQYFLSLNGKTRDSYTFTIEGGPYEGMLRDAVNFFYQHRSGEFIDQYYITSTGENISKYDLAEQSFDDTPDMGYIQQEWSKSYSSSSSDEDEYLLRQVDGGWYETESNAKSVIKGASAAWMLMNLYERAYMRGEEWRYDSSNYEIVTPEEYDYTPDILNEVRHELDFLLSMRVPEELKYELKSNGAPETENDTKKYGNMLFHQIQNSIYTPLAVHTYEYTNGAISKDMKRIIKPPTTAATLAGAAVFAQAARLFRAYDLSYADNLQEAAVLAYNAAKENPELYAPDEDVVRTGPTGDMNTADDFYWAACELFITTGEAEYLNDLENSEEYAFKFSTVLNGGQNCNTVSSFNCGNTAGYGNLSLILHDYMLNGKQETDLKTSLRSTADAYLKYEEENAFSVPYAGTKVEDPIGMPGDGGYSGYENGSNGIILNNAILIAYAYDQTGIYQYLEGASAALNYILGCNPLNISYVTGTGTNAVKNPTHHFWAHEIDAEFPSAPDGVLVSGPNSALNDPYVKALGMEKGKIPPQLCYTDDIEAWSVNSCSLTLNASLAWIEAFFSEGYEPYGHEVKDVIGDVSGDHYLGIADAIVLSKYLTGIVRLRVDQFNAADLNNDGQVNAIDLTLLKQMLIADMYYY